MRSNKSWIEISESALRKNLELLGSALCEDGHEDDGSRTDASLLAVIKADAYGHGAAACAPVLARAGAAWFGVTDAEEGVVVRQALSASGIAAAAQPHLLVMCGMESGDEATLVEKSLTPVVWFPEQLDWLARKADVSVPLAVHVEIDTGMARQGVLPGHNLAQLLSHLEQRPELRLEGVLTHFASAEIAGSPQTRQQQMRFESALDQVRSRGLRPQWLHAGNTATIDEARLLPWIRAQAARCGARLLARTGLALYGYALPLQGGASVIAPRLERVATWKARVVALQELAAGEAVGYNGTFVAKQPMRLALLPVGYADGLRRELSGSTERPGGWTMVRGRRAPIVGRISMNLTTVDVSAIPEVMPGDEVVLLGDGVSADEHARIAGTIAYEILCAMRGTQRLVP